jgi:anti-anti-sigma factor
MEPMDPEPPELATLEIGWRGGLLVGRLDGEVDLSNAAALQERILAALVGARGLVLDLAGVTYLDSAGLALLSRIQMACAALAIGMACVVVEGTRSGRTMQVAGFELAGMRLVGSVEEGEARLSGHRRR